MVLSKQKKFRISDILHVLQRVNKAGHRLPLAGDLTTAGDSQTVYLGSPNSWLMGGLPGTTETDCANVLQIKGCQSVYGQGVNPVVMESHSKTREG